VPIYDYSCDSCHKTFEVSQKFTDEPLQTCQYCSGRVRKLISAPAVVFKGSGWYVTDYPNKDRKNAMEAENKKAKGTPPSCATSDCSSSCPGTGN
jgi:putative FmdB family regulatory protein